MNFEVALTLMRKGAYVRRAHWDSGFLSLHTDGPEPVIIVHLKAGRMVTWFMDQRDILADDWAEYVDLRWKDA
jgi:hypothetical protein